MATYDLCVVICTRNRHKSLQRALDSLARQASSRSWEVLVVDNGSVDGTAVFLQSLPDQYPVPLRATLEPEPGISPCRNRGIREARSRVLLFTDDDATFLPGWVEAHARSFDHSGISGTGGKILPVLPETTPETMRTALTTQTGGPAACYDLGSEPLEISRGSGLPLPFGTNMGVLREAALKVGGFRTDLGWGSPMSTAGEETEFFGRLRDRGDRIRYVPDAVLLHHVVASKVTVEYWCRFFSSYGRHLEIITPEKNVFFNGLRAFKYAAKYLKYSLRRLLERPETPETLKKRARARGRLELLVLKIFRPGRYRASLRPCPPRSAFPSGDPPAPRAA